MDCPRIDSGYRENNRAIRIALSDSGDVSVFKQSFRNRTIQALLFIRTKISDRSGSIVKVVKLD